MNVSNEEETHSTGSAMAEIQLSNLSKRWGNFVAVDNFDLTIRDKEFLVLLGPSGCGKTTTMRMIMRTPAR